MNQILLSFLCGAAFIGGAVAMFVLAIMFNTFKTKRDRDELMDYWRKSTEHQAEQIAALYQIAAKLSERDKTE